MKRFLSPGFFAIAIAMFFLPFVSVSCNTSALSQLEGLEEGFGDATIPETRLPEGDIEVSARGFDIVLGSELDSGGLEQLGQDFGGAIENNVQTGQDDSYPGRIFAILALVVAVAGLGLAFLGARIAGIATLAAGALGALFLFLLKSSFDGEFGAATLFGFDLKYKIGYWLAFLAMVGGAVGGLLVLLEARGPSGLAAPPGGTPPPPPGGTTPPPGDPPPPAT